MQSTGRKTAHATIISLKCYSFYRVERRFRILQFCATFITQNKIFLFTSYFGGILLLFHLSQITENIMFFYADYSKEIYVKYTFSSKMFRKLQDSIVKYRFLRKCFAKYSDIVALSLCKKQTLRKIQ